MKLPAFRKIMTDWPEFVDFWSCVYYHEDEDERRPDSTFLKHLRWPGGRLESRDLDFLFEWKNGGRLSARKSLVPARVKQRLSEFNKLRRSSYDEVKVLAESCTAGDVWMRFICHITTPSQCPIWDKNVLRAFQIISGRTEDSDEIYEDSIYREYSSFFHDALTHLPQKTRPSTFRRLDQALFAFGRHYVRRSQ